MSQEEVIALSHRLRGTANSFGLVRVGAAAAAIEQAAVAGEDTSPLVLELEDAIVVTRRDAMGEKLGSAA